MSTEKTASKFQGETTDMKCNDLMLHSRENNWQGLLVHVSDLSDLLEIVPYVVGICEEWLYNRAYGYCSQSWEMIVYCLRKSTSFLIKQIKREDKCE